MLTVSFSDSIDTSTSDSLTNDTSTCDSISDDVASTCDTFSEEISGVLLLSLRQSFDVHRTTKSSLTWLEVVEFVSCLRSAT